MAGFFYCPSLMKFQSTTNVRDVIAELEAAGREAVPAVVRALNKTVAQVKVQAAREVRDAGYKLKISDIKSAIRVRQASSGRLRADAVASGRPISLIRYGARQVSSGVSVEVLHGRKVILGAFIAKGKGGSPQVFVREASAVHKKVIKNGKAQWSALPIRKLYGPGIPDAMASKAVETALVALINERFPSILQHEHAWLAKRLARR
jgi:hypothetical protein